MSDPELLDYRNAAADPRPVLPYLDPKFAVRRELPGDQMAFGFGCLTSALFVVPGAVVLATVPVPAAASGRAVWPVVVVAVVVAVQLTVGLVIGLRLNRWGYLKGVGWSVVGLAVVIGLIFFLLR